MTMIWFGTITDKGKRMHHTIAIVLRKVHWRVILLIFLLLLRHVEIRLNVDMYREREYVDSMVSFYMFSTLLVSYTTNYPKRTFHPTHQIQIPHSGCLLYLCLYYFSNLFSFNIDPYTMLSSSVIKQFATFSIN